MLLQQVPADKVHSKYDYIVIGAGSVQSLTEYKTATQTCYSLKQVNLIQNHSYLRTSCTVYMA